MMLWLITHHKRHIAKSTRRRTALRLRERLCLCMNMIVVFIYLQLIMCLKHKNYFVHYIYTIVTHLRGSSMSFPCKHILHDYSNFYALAAICAR